MLIEDNKLVSSRLKSSKSTIYFSEIKCYSYAHRDDFIEYLMTPTYMSSI